MENIKVDAIKFGDLKTLPCLISLTRIPLGIAMLVLWHFDFSKLVIMPLGLAGAFTDYLDGHLARKKNQCTRMGELLDPLCDKFLVACATWIVITDVQWETHEIVFAIILIAFEAIFIAAPLVAAFTTQVSVASLKPGKIRLNLECLALLSFYLGLDDIAHKFIFSALVFAVLTCEEGVKLIIKLLNADPQPNEEKTEI